VLFVEARNAALAALLNQSGFRQVGQTGDLFWLPLPDPAEAGQLG
jgi:hypothetical protein